MISEPSVVPEIDLSGFGPCGKPCDHPCDEPCDDHAEGGAGDSGVFGWLKASLFNAMDVCFDDVYQEPKTILMVGCRQLDFAQHIALLLPAAEIVLLDPDEAEAQRAKEEICCRFKFVSAPLEALPFENEAFDLVIAHNLFGYTADWTQGFDEICRVTRRNLFFSMHRPLVWKLFSPITVLKQALCRLGTELPARLPETFDVLSRLYLFGKVKTKLAPFPWTAYMTEMRPLREEKTVLPA